MIPLVAPTFFARFPGELRPLVDSGILLAALVAVLLNALFNGSGRSEAARAQAVAAAGEHL